MTRSRACTNSGSLDALAITAAESGRVYYGTLAGLIESLAQAQAAGQPARRLRVLTHPVLLVVDEIGYLPASREDAVVFFQLINGRRVVNYLSDK